MINLWCRCCAVGLSYKGSCHLVGIVWMIKGWWSIVQICIKDYSESAVTLNLELLIRVPFSHFVILHSHLLPHADVRGDWQTFPSVSSILYHRFNIRCLIFCCNKHYINVNVLWIIYQIMKCVQFFIICITSLWIYALFIVFPFLPS